MNYREFQAAIKQFRDQGLTEKSFKLNQKKTILMSEYERVTKLDMRPDKSTDMDEVSLLKIRIAELESENKSLKNKLDIANETIDALNETVDSTTTKFDEYIENVNELVKDSYQSGYNDCKKDYEANDPAFDDSQLVWEFRERLVRGVNIDGHLKGSILDVLSDGTPERVEKERHHLEKLIDTADEGDSDTVKPEIEYEIIECENGVIIERDNITPINTNEDTHNIDEVPDLDDDE